MSRVRVDHYTELGLRFTALLSAGMSVLILVWVGIEAWPAFRETGLARMLGDSRWLPGSSRAPEFGILPTLAASVMVTVGAVVPAAMIGVFCALYQQFYAGERIQRLLRQMLELLAGIPSVVLGFWGLTLLVPLIQAWQPPGQGLFTASIVLCIMIVPTIALTSTAALKAVPEEMLRAAAALGMSRPRTALQVVLPYAKNSIRAGIVLAATRAIGETMAVLMVCGNIAEWPKSIFAPIRPVTSTIALEMGYATAEHRSVLFALGFALILLVALSVGTLEFSKKAR